MSGFYIAQFAMGGVWVTIGFSILSGVWFYSTLMAARFAMTRQIEKHYRWARRSYALTFAAITQRTLLLLPLLTSTPFMPVYRLSAWLPWMFNLLLVEYLLFRKNRKVTFSQPT